ncbi:hypothetical protein PIB30_009702 [Stylosanthes scabra]|uniref:PB1-like domain-containing protein n=1 Tax=Stylosanthes scabra TaxID=79078 RepID=A0ABU6V6Q8_9FABA|nr:hypothetical protein [Stylosanthes scabra]
MASIFVKPGFHVGGRFGRNEDGVNVYVDGQIEKFEVMDIDFVNYEDLAGLHKLEGDADINAMCEYLMMNIGLTDEFHIYVEHKVDIPVPTSDEGEPNVEAVLVSTSTPLQAGETEAATSTPLQAPKSPPAGPSKETMAAASLGAQSFTSLEIVLS